MEEMIQYLLLAITSLIMVRFSSFNLQNAQENKLFNLDLEGACAGSAPLWIRPCVD